MSTLKNISIGSKLDENLEIIIIPPFRLITNNPNRPKLITDTYEILMKFLYSLTFLWKWQQGLQIAWCQDARAFPEKFWHHLGKLMRRGLHSPPSVHPWVESIKYWKFSNCVTSPGKIKSCPWAITVLKNIMHSHVVRVVHENHTFLRIVQ